MNLEGIESKQHFLERKKTIFFFKKIRKCFFEFYLFRWRWSKQREKLYEIFSLIAKSMLSSFTLHYSEILSNLWNYVEENENETDYFPAIKPFGRSLRLKSRVGNDTFMIPMIPKILGIDTWYNKPRYHWYHWYNSSF
jgi:hypothetical protein